MGSVGGVTMDSSTLSMGGEDCFGGVDEAVWETLMIILIRSETLDNAFFKGNLM